VPCDALVGHLFGDDRIPLLAFSADIGTPVLVGVVKLPDFLHAFHEFREILKLRPLIVSSGNGNVNFNCFVDGGHVRLR
jgi:hypothetical protein